jgi:AAA+ superfamily predicted ATPase
MSIPLLPTREAPELATTAQLPLRGWTSDFARRWNGGTYSLFVLQGNVFDLFPLVTAQGTSYVPLGRFLMERLFPSRDGVLFYDVADGLSFGSPGAQTRFYKWLKDYDEVEKTNYHVAGPPKEFTRLCPVLQRFFRMAKKDKGVGGITLIVNYPEKLIPAADGPGSSPDERANLITLLKWAASADMAETDLGIILVTEAAAKLQEDLLQNPYIAQVRIELPDIEERVRFLKSSTIGAVTHGKPLSSFGDFTEEELASRLAGLNLLRIRHFVAECVRNEIRITSTEVATSKKRQIEDYCQGLVRFKDPKPGLSLDCVATHEAAKKKLRELAWLIKNDKKAVLEKGVLLPGRVGVGKSFLVECFASECGLPVMEIGEFRSKWVGDTERQQARVLATIRALGPVIAVVDEADAVFGGRDGDGDSGVSGRVFAAFAAHIGDSSLRGRELWIAMTSRPDRLAIDMKRQGRFGLCIPLFAAQGPDDVVTLFKVVAGVKKVKLSDEILAYIRTEMGAQPLTGSDVESIVVRSMERATLETRDDDVRLEDLQAAVGAFIDPLDRELLALQEIAAILACSDRRFLPPKHAAANRSELVDTFAYLKSKIGGR